MLDDDDGSHSSPCDPRRSEEAHWLAYVPSLARAARQNGGNVKVVQELLRHATTRITMEVYQQAEQDAKRAALSPFSGSFVVPKKAS
jgi:integrase